MCTARNTTQANSSKHDFLIKTSQETNPLSYLSRPLLDASWYCICFSMPLLQSSYLSPQYNCMLVCNSCIESDISLFLVVYCCGSSASNWSRLLWRKTNNESLAVNSRFLSLLIFNSLNQYVFLRMYSVCIEVDTFRKT